MVWLGLISYPLYLLHLLVIAVIDTSIPLLNIVLWVAVSIALSWMVYRWFEVPIRRLGRRITTVAAHP